MTKRLLRVAAEIQKLQDRSICWEI